MNTAKWSRGRVLGRGSTATVSLASSPSSGEELFAVKSADVALSELLQRERRIHSLVAGSPYVVSYLGYDITYESTGTYYNLLLEYAPGGSLSDEIKNRGGRLAESDIRARTRDIVCGLAHLHSKKIAHCDVKGRNVLIGRDGRAKIADLGCARFVDGGDGVGKTRFMGTPMFMAPEVARGEEQGTAADVWAVGCSVIEMATGGPPWPDATDAVALLHRVGFSGVVPAVPDWISEEGKDFLRKCLKREAWDRWTADELLKHPFLSNSANSDSGCKWTSPRSTLDQTLWDSFSEAEVVEATNSVSNKPNPVTELFSNSSSPDWTWNESWLTVRINDQITVDEEDKDNNVVANSQISTGISADEFMFIANRAVTGDSGHVVSDDCERADVISSGNCDTVTMLWISNWIFPLVPVFRFAFVLSSLLCCLR